MPQPNGKAPQHHLTTAEIIEKAQARRLVPFHWHVVGLDLLLRPWSTAEIADRVDQEVRFAAAKAEYEATRDEGNFVTSAEQVRYKLGAALPCVLYADDRTPVFTLDDVDQLLDTFPTADVMEVVLEVERISNFTAKQAEDDAKNSAAMAGSSTSSGSPEGAATSMSSPTPIR